MIAMANTTEFKITCYLHWCGAETTLRLATRHEYDAARAFLNKIAIVQASRNQNVAADYYFIDESRRALFQSFTSALE